MTRPLPAKIGAIEGGGGPARPSVSSVCHLSFFDIDAWKVFLEWALPSLACGHRRISGRR